MNKSTLKCIVCNSDACYIHRGHSLCKECFDDESK